jgi:exodeoxyribonuclease-5
MKSNHFLKGLIKAFPFEPTSSQLNFFPAIVDFLFKKKYSFIFILTGYAGTGKTTLIGFLNNQLVKLNYKSILMAPTGRAAKVMSSYSKMAAFTIHKQIYYPKSNSSGGISFKLKQNKMSNTIFIIDEASMIGNDNQKEKLFDNGSLLNDIIQYVSSGYNCKLIFVGDTAQLPPIGLDLSPALSPVELNKFFLNEILHVNLDNVVRQAKDSGILYNATNLRKQIKLQMYNDVKFKLDSFTDIISISSGDELFEEVQNSFSKPSVQESVFIVRSNKRANIFNKNIRNRILFLEEQLSVGDQLMVVKNNYFWLSSDSKPGFIANGDVILIKTINNYKNLYGFSFAEVSVSLLDYPTEKAFDTVILLDTLESNTASLSYDDSNKLYKEVKEDYNDEKSNYKKLLSVKKNPFFNALQVKYSYAITCHKSQGGQWNNVFVEYPYLPNGPDKDYFRWLYTALTRAKEKLYLIGFPKENFE